METKKQQEIFIQRKCFETYLPVRTWRAI